MRWRKFCSAASHPYGKQYKAAFRKSVFPSQIPYLINGAPKGSLQEAVQNILDQIFLSPAIPTNYKLTTPTQPPDPPFSPQEISAVIEHLPSGKAPGIDGIDNLLIKIIHKRFNNIFPTLFNKCLHLSCFPDSLKIGNIILFQKGPAAGLLLSSYLTLTHNREGVGETYDSEADLSSGVHQQPERPTAWLQRRQVCGYSHPTDY
ncbi:hypothetical protein AVEN_113780-1 [Araneus ventricosus]|uniref:Reverse transcriptase domain-containing protein n=1 Tax=Araneus ventricosus TaxID=182803 RepID=A0A4Y2U782_ARAVE|nr:hypothetical protein AVEN_113780-1 [Araneus ventricosus]